jgi:hypothetical protein
MRAHLRTLEKARQIHLLESGPLSASLSQLLIELPQLTHPHRWSLSETNLSLEFEGQ